MAVTRVHILPTLTDNFTYLLENRGRAIVIDPGEADAPLALLRRRRLELEWVLNTHHHGDHTAGNQLLRQATGCRVIAGGTDPPAGVDRTVGEGDGIVWRGGRLLVWATPGHSAADVCFLAEGGGTADPPAVWTGDVLFVGGCGRCFSGDPQRLYRSLQRLAGLPDDTRVYCGHEYALENYRFALHVAPDNAQVRRRVREVSARIDAGCASVPGTIGEERRSNIFLRAHDPALKRSLGMPSAPDAEVFAHLRRRKDRF